MERRSASRTSKSALSNRTAESADSSVKIDTGKFSFPNGDRYEGGYKLDFGRRVLVKQDRGVYTTDNSDVYDGAWKDDKFAGGEFHVRYNDNARYEGDVDENGAMHGAGTYVFPDDSSLTAVWSRNRPVADIVYKDPSGHEWTLESISNDKVSFATGNHFWDEMCAATSKGGSLLSSSVQQS